MVELFRQAPFAYLPLAATGGGALALASSFPLPAGCGDACRTPRALEFETRESGQSQTSVSGSMCTIFGGGQARDCGLRRKQ